MYDIIAIMIPIVLAGCVVLIVRVVADAGVLKRLADTHTDPEVIRLLLGSAQQNRSAGLLTWAILLLAVGFALIMVGALGLGADDPVAFGLLLVSAGVGLIVALVVALRRK